jgi:phosphatidylglycerophosphatase A
VEAVLKKSEVAHAILTGVALDEMAEKKKLKAGMQMVRAMNNFK